MCFHADSLNEALLERHLSLTDLELRLELFDRVEHGNNLACLDKVALLDLQASDPRGFDRCRRGELDNVAGWLEPTECGDGMALDGGERRGRGSGIQQPVQLQSDGHGDDQKPHANKPRPTTSCCAGRYRGDRLGRRARRERTGWPVVLAKGLGHGGHHTQRHPGTLNRSILVCYIV